MDSDEEYTYEEDDGDYTYEEDGDDLGNDHEVTGSPGTAENASSSSSSSSAERRKSGRMDESSPKGSTKLVVPDGGFIIKEYADLLPIMQSLISEVSSLLNLDRDRAEILLQMHRWNKERLVEQFFANPEKMLEEAGLGLYSFESMDEQLNQNSSSASVSSSTEDTFVCRICCDPCPLSSGFHLGCAHRFCRPCYGEYLRNQVGDGPSCVKAHCPEHKCKQSATRSMFEVLTEPVVSERYDLFVVRNFIETSRSMRYCPAAHCNKVAIGCAITTVRCECGYPFCFRCGEESHDPSSCSQLSVWSEKCSNESETANWILANTKKCPKCHARIEKNQGCNHMNCKLCKYEFCWICMGCWTDHGQNTGGFYKCNRYDATKADANSSAAVRAKAELDRYLFFYQRFHGHDHALKFASSQREQAERRMVEKQEQDRSSWIDVQFLKQATELVIECRRVLKYTYVLGYSLPDESPAQIQHKNLFEHHQEMLEKNTEKLHEYTEQPLDTMDRTQVVNLTRVTERFMQSLLSTMSGGGVGEGEVGSGREVAEVSSGDSMSVSSTTAAVAVTTGSSKGGKGKSRK